MNRDAQSWQKILASAPPQDIPSLCLEALEIWPLSTELWILYINNIEDKASAFAKCLESSVDPKLFMFYLNYVKTNSSSQLGEAYEYALDVCSCDPESGGIWKEYIDFISQQPSANDWQEQFKMDKLRKAFKKCVSLPLNNVESLWKRYGLFENKISRVSARKFIDERSAAYMRARQTLKTYQSLTSDMDLSTMQSPFTAIENASKWMQYINFERENLLELDENGLKLRVNFAYKRATICARWSPQLWFFAGVTENIEFLINGFKAIPDSLLLGLKLSDHFEKLNDFDKVRETLLSLTSTLNSLELDSTQAWCELIRAARRMRGVSTAREVIKEALNEANLTPNLYITAASLEPLDVQTRIWRAGYTKFGTSSLFFVSKYLEFLFESRDVVNARAVFELAIASYPETRSLWNQMLELECKYSQSASTSLEALQNLETRVLERFSDVNEMDLFMKRYADLDVDFGLPVHTEPESTASVIPENSKLAQLMDLLPAAASYDGPLLNTNLLMQIIQQTPVPTTY